MLRRHKSPFRSEETTMKVYAAGRVTRLFSLALLSLGAAHQAGAIPVNYEFSTGPAWGAFNLTGSANPSLLGALTGLTVSGSFTYDSETPLSSTVDGPFVVGQRNYLGAFSNFAATVGAFSIAQSGEGSGQVANEGFVASSSDFFQLSTFSDGMVLTDLSLALVNARLFWIEGQLMQGAITPIPDFLNDSNLPGAPPSFAGRLALDFLSLTLPPENPAALNFAFFDGLVVRAAPTAVAEPGILSLILIGGLALLFVATRQRGLRIRSARSN
jgi:hypothetical protein